MQYRTGHLAEAVTSLERALKTRPDYSEALRLFGQVLADRGDVDGAVLKLGDALRVQRSWTNAFALGFVQYRAGRYQQAIDSFRLATELAPGNVGGYQMLGTTYYVLGDVQQAIGNFEHAVRLGPSASAFANLGMAYYESGKYDEALRSYAAALEADPRSAVNHRNIGDVYQRIGRLREARAEYQRAIDEGASLLSVNPRDVRTIALVALCEAKLGRGAAAERHAAEAVALAPTNREALQRSAEVYALLNQPDAALKASRPAVTHGFESRMARNDDELASLRKLPKFEQILGNSPGNASEKQGARE